MLEQQRWTTTLKSPRHRGLCRWPRSRQLAQGLTWEVCVRVHATHTPAYSDTAAFFIFLRLHLQCRPDLFRISMETSAVKLTHVGLTCGHELSFCSLLVPHLAPLSVCVSAWVCMCVLGATSAVSQWYNCTSLDIKIDTFNSLSTFLSIQPTGRLRLPPPPPKTTLINESQLGVCH